MQSDPAWRREESAAAAGRKGQAAAAAAGGELNPFREGLDQSRGVKQEVQGQKKDECNGLSGPQMDL